MDDHILEELQKACRLVMSLAKEVDVKNEKLFRIESKLDETFRMMMEEKAKLQQVQRAFSQGMLHFINSKFVSNSTCFKFIYSYLTTLCVCTPKIEWVEYMLSWLLHACVISLMTYSFYRSHIGMGLKLLICSKWESCLWIKKNNFAALARLKQPSNAPTNYTCENLSGKSELNGVYVIKNC